MAIGWTHCTRPDPVRGALLFGAAAVLAGCPAAASGPALPDALSAGWQGKPVCELLQQTSATRMLRCTFPPGVGHERHFHPAHTGYALSGGQMRITTEGGTRVAAVKRGSSFASEGIAWHEVRNVGTTPVIYLIVEQRRPEESIAR